MTDLMAHFETRLEFLIDLLSQLIACESPSTDKAAVDRLGALVAARCRALGAEVTVEPRAAVGDVILAKWNAAAPGKPILTLAHMDTVHPPGALAVMPLRREADRLYGPGAVDMKGGIAVLLGVVAELQGLGLFPNRPIWSLFTTDEELGSAHSAGIIQEVARQVGLVLVLEGAMYPEKLKTGRKSTGTFTIGVTGRPAHAGVEPEKGVNAIIEMARQVERIGALADPAQGTTVTPTVIHGGDRTNVVPAEATLIVDVRVATAAEGERLTCAMQGLAPILPGASLSVKGGFDRPPMERNALMLQTFACAAEIAARIGHPPLEEGTTGGGSDGNYTAALGIPTLDGVGPGGNGAHTQDEYVWIPTMARRAALLAGLLRYWPAL